MSYTDKAFFILLLTFSTEQRAAYNGGEAQLKRPNTATLGIRVMAIAPAATTLDHRSSKRQRLFSFLRHQRHEMEVIGRPVEIIMLAVFISAVMISVMILLLAMHHAVQSRAISSLSYVAICTADLTGRMVCSGCCQRQIFQP